ITSGSLYHGRGKDVPILSILSWDITGCSNLSATCRRPSTKHGTMRGLQRPDSHNSLSHTPGTVPEADETYAGGKASCLHADQTEAYVDGEVHTNSCENSGAS